MRIGVLGDVHSNLEALDAVVTAMQRDERIDLWVQVGDIVGYGANPRACIDRIRELGCVVAIGNHDAAVAGRLDMDYFNAYARLAIEWTRTQLTSEYLSYLAELPLFVEHEHFTVVHGSQHMPEQFGYVISPVEAVDSMRQQNTKATFVGHSHVPAVYLQRTGTGLEQIEYRYDAEIDVSLYGVERVLVNVGSVGQPRDEDPRAAYCVYDTDEQTVRIARVEYDIAGAQAKIQRAGLPSVLAERLALGV